MSSPESTDAGTEVEEAPVVDDLRDGVVARVRELLGDGVVDSFVAPGQDMWVRVTNEAWPQAAEVLRNVLGARYFCFLSAIDWQPSPFGRYLDAEVDKVLAAASAEAPEPIGAGPIETGVTGGDTRFQVIARITNIREHWGITLKADTGSDDEPRIGTWTRTFAGADWHERETWEMFGITFEGHPHLRHIYLPGDFEGNPLRKDFPLVARIVKPWPGIVDVEPMPAVAEGGDSTAGSSATTEAPTEGATE